MAGQLAFDFGAMPEWPKHPQPVFFCILPTRTAAEEARRIGRGLAAELGCRVDDVAAERLHITLQRLGDMRWMPNRRLDAARRAAEEIAFAPFEVTFENVLTLRSSARPFPSALMGFNANVRAFNKSLSEGLAANGFRASGTVNPHMTLFYATEPVIPRAIDPVCFRASEFVLIRSVQGRGRHHVLGRWPLRFR